ncbi:hypothetical protein HDU67_007403 [Dinochytrium kinnereticum]|nr:hypothetical protein HDU67_007403 [Dinochytrium kinnereticum]
MSRVNSLPRLDATVMGVAGAAPVPSSFASSTTLPPALLVIPAHSDETRAERSDVADTFITTVTTEAPVPSFASSTALPPALLIPAHSDETRAERSDAANTFITTVTTAAPVPSFASSTTLPPALLIPAHSDETRAERSDAVATFITTVTTPITPAYTPRGATLRREDDLLQTLTEEITRERDRLRRERTARRSRHGNVMEERRRSIAGFARWFEEEAVRGRRVEEGGDGLGGSLSGSIVRLLEGDGGEGDQMGMSKKSGSKGSLERMGAIRRAGKKAVPVSFWSFSVR